jgi:riboflavin synthase
MFTGIVTDLGHVRRISHNGDTRFEIETNYDTAAIDIGASIACSGACLTVVEKGRGWFAADVSAETLSCTTLGSWTKGTPINLERPLKAADELGGHIVSGHVDGVGKVQNVRPEGDSKRFVFEAPPALMRYIAAKGSITVDGVSLTVNEVDGSSFGVNIIPHTQEMTTLGTLSEGSSVNLEIDLVARYVARLLGRD